MKKARGQSPQVNDSSARQMLYDRLELYSSRSPKKVLGFSLVLGSLLAILLFDVKLSVGGDDSVYILQAQDFVKKGVWPIGFKAPGYPIILSLFVLLGNMNILILKMSSFLFFLASLVSFYFIFRKRAEPLVFYPALILFSANVLVLEFAHQTYSEVLFLLIQLGAIHFLWKTEEEPEASTTRLLFLTSLFATLGFYVRAIGATVPIAMFIYFALQKQWKRAGLFTLFCSLLYAPLKILEYMKGVVVIEQVPMIFLKNPYDATKGAENFWGFVARIYNNVVNYFNFQFAKALSLPSPDFSPADGLLLPNGMLSVIGFLVTGILIMGLFHWFRKQRQGFAFLSVYAAVYVFFISFALQNIYATPRMVVPLVPLLLIAFLCGYQEVLHRFLKTGSRITPTFRRWYVFGVAGLLFSNGFYVQKSVSANLPVLRENLRGNEFYGYSIDWVNYLNACRWIGSNLPKDSVGVICRKPEFLQIYSGGYLAHGVYQIESTHPDTVVANWKKWGMTHLLYDNFQWSGTLRRYVQPVAEKYPALFVLLHKEGIDAPSLIYRLQYAAIPSR